MDFDFQTLAPDDRYKILASTVVPRPIAWVTTLSRAGVRNAAPFSFFNALSKDPPLLAIGIQADKDGTMKDTARNILDTREFVVNLVPRAAQDAMNATSAGVAPDVDELTLAGLDTRPSVKVAPPRIAASPVAFECRLHMPIEPTPNQLIAIGEIVHAHVGDAFVLDASRHHVATEQLDLIGRMQGRDWYVDTHGAFQIARP